MAEYRVVVTDVAGVPTAELDNANIESVSWELNGFGGAQFTIPTLDPKCLKLHCCHRDPTFWSEVQIWRNGSLIQVGPPLVAEAEGGVTTVRCAGLMWYASRRHIGPNTSQFLTNADFESGLASWTAIGTTATASTANRLLGTQSLKLVNASAGQDYYEVQGFTINPGGSPGFQITLDVAGWFYLDGSAWIGPALNERGLHVHSRQGATIYNEQYQPINNDSPRNKWTKLVTQVAVPTGVTSDVDVRLYSPGGTVYWDATAVKVSSFVGASPAADLGTILANVAHSGFDGWNIGVSCAAVGVNEDRQFLTEDHGNVWQIISEWPTRDLSDVEVTWNSAGTTRTFTSWSPRKGTLRVDRVLGVGGAGERPGLKSWRWVVDGSQAATSVRVIGQGSGPTREFGFAESTSAFGGVSLHQVIAASAESTIGVYDTTARAELFRIQRPVRIPALTVDADPFMDLALGDTIPVTADFGWLQDSFTNYRVVGKKLVPAQEALTLTLNLP